MFMVISRKPLTLPNIYKIQDKLSKVISVFLLRIQNNQIIGKNNEKNKFW